MSQVCQITGKKPMAGNNVAHCNKRVRRRFNPNLRHLRFWVPSQQRYVKLLVSRKGIRTIDKIGIEAALGRIQKREKSN